LASLARAVSDLASEDTTREWKALEGLDPRWRDTFVELGALVRTADLGSEGRRPMWTLLGCTLDEILLALDWLGGARPEPRLTHVELPRGGPLEFPFPLVLVGFEPGYSDDAFARVRELAPTHPGLSVVEHDPRRGMSAYVAGFVVVPPEGLCQAIQLTVNKDWSSQTARDMTPDDLAAFSGMLRAHLPVSRWEFGGEGALMSERIMRPAEVVGGLEVVRFERRRQLWRRSVVEWGANDVHVRRLGSYGSEHDDVLLGFRVAAGFGYVRPRVALVWGTSHEETWWPPHLFPL
jgi:hypothetical protein